MLCILYLVLLVYASLMPLAFTEDWSTARERIRRAGQDWPFGGAGFRQRADKVANLLVYIPLGMLVATRLSRGGAARRLAAFLAGVLVCGSASAMVEFAQAFSPHRYTSVTDLLMNVSGGSLGAVAGAAVGMKLWRRAVAVVQDWHVERPLLLVAILMLALLAADALYPLWPTTDIGTVKHNIRSSKLDPAEGFAVHPWHHWIVHRVGVSAVLTAVLAGGLGKSGIRRWVHAALVVTAFALAFEAGKVLIVSRHANVANVMASWGGVVVGLLCGVLFWGSLRSRVLAGLAVVLLAGYLGYGAWRPFVFEFSVARLKESMPRGAHWLPLYHYAMGSPRKAPNAVRTLALMGALTYATAMCLKLSVGRFRSRTWFRAALLAGFFGFVLEFMQAFVVAIPSRVPSTTDVFCAAMGGLLGVWVYRYYPSRPSA